MLSTQRQFQAANLRDSLYFTSIGFPRILAVGSSKQTKIMNSLCLRESTKEKSSSDSKIILRYLFVLKHWKWLSLSEIEWHSHDQVGSEWDLSNCSYSHVTSVWSCCFRSIEDEGRELYRPNPRWWWWWWCSRWDEMVWNTLEGCHHHHSTLPLISRQERRRVV